MKTEVIAVTPGELVFIFGDCGPFRVVHVDAKNEHVWMCSEDEWLLDGGASVFPPTEGLSFFDLYPDSGYLFEAVSVELGPDNTVGLHRMIDKQRTACGLKLARCLLGYVRYGAASQKQYVTCKECLEEAEKG